MVAYKKEFKGVPSALTFLTSDGITGAHIVNGKIAAKGSKYDGKDATEKNLLTAADYTGYDLPKTDLSNYIKQDNKQMAGAFSDWALGSLGLRQGTGFSDMERYRDLYERRDNLSPTEQKKFFELDKLLSQNIPQNVPQNIPQNIPQQQPGTGMNNNMNKNMLVKLATMSKLFPGLVS